MKRSFLDKLEERMRDLETARRVFYELGGDDEEPAHLMRTAMPTKKLGKRAQPLLVVRRREEAVAEAEPKPPRKQRKAKHGNHITARAIVYKLFLDAENKPMSSGELADRWPGRVALIGKKRQPLYQALHEGKKLGLMRYNEEDRVYALSEAGLRVARGEVSQANASQ